MKKFILSLLICMPLSLMAQSTWEVPLTPEQKLEAAKKAEQEAKQAIKDAKKARKEAEKARKAAEKAAVQKAKEEAKMQAKAKVAAEQQAKIKNEADAQAAVDGSDFIVPTQVSKADKLKAEREAKAEKAREAKARRAVEGETKGQYLPDASELKEDPKYLDGAITEVDGKVMFTLDIDVPGKNADDIYNMVYNFMDTLTQSDNQISGSRIALVSPKKHIAVATVKEWLVFSSSFISLDRTEIDYTLIATCSDGHLHLTMERIGYKYEANTNHPLIVKAEEWITDKYGLNKKHTDVSRMSGKFRKKTIDRKNQLFKQIKEILK